MHRNRIVALGFAAAALACAAVWTTAGQDKPRWMEPEQGFIDADANARIDSVTQDAETGAYRIEISLPKLDTSIEEVVVIGHRPQRPELVLPRIPYEIINDLDAQRAGIIVYLGEKQNFSLRINYTDGTQAALPAMVGELKP